MLLSLKNLSTLSLTVLWNKLRGEIGGGGEGGQEQSNLFYYILYYSLNTGYLQNTPYPGLGKTGVSLLTSSPTWYLSSTLKE